MQFTQVVEVLQELETTRSRNAMTERLALFLAEVPNGEVKEACYLILGQLGPLFARVDFGMAEKMVIRAVARATDQSPEAVTRLFKETGDPGEATQQLRSEQVAGKSESLTIHDVFERLLGVARAAGAGSQELKVSRLADLLSAVSPEAGRFVVRMVMGKMRLGFSDKTIMDALAVMDGGSKQGREALESAYQLAPDIGVLAELVKHHGLTLGAQQVTAVVGVPIMPALAQRLKSPDEMIAKMGKVIVDPKYDGVRTEIHVMKAGKQDGFIKTFARSLEDTSAMFPELTRIADQIEADSVIIDAEAVGYEPTTGKLLPFQETITRKRKHGVAGVAESIPIRFYCFDLLYLNGKHLLAEPLWKRRTLLSTVIQAGTVLVEAPYLTTESADELRAYHQQQLGAGLEGAMVKQYDGVYQPGRTGWNWVKFKEAETSEAKLADTIDGVVLGYYRGKGKRSGFGIGAFLLGVFHEATGTYVSVAKVGTGLTDEQWREMKRRGDEVFAMEKPTEYNVSSGLTPDVWLTPSVVVEVAADEITRSPAHTAGISLRFPRLVRFRDDKRAAQATTVKELETLSGLF